MMLRIKDYTTKVGSGVTPRGGAETYLDEGIPLFRSQNVTNDGFLMDDIAFISEEVDESMKGTRVKPGDVLLNITGASIGRCYYTSDDFVHGNVNQHVCIIRPKKNEVIASYLHYCIISDIGQQQIDLTQTGANREGLAIEDIKGFTFDIPSLSEQQRIVDYLNKYLSKINSQIEILEKQRNAYARLKKSIIHQAVTRGLNPNVPLKDSGIEWIGMIPEHWEGRRLKDFSVLNPRFTGQEKRKEVSFLPMEGLRYDSITLQSISFEEGKSKYTFFAEGDLLMAKVTPCFENGNIAIATDLKEGIGFGSSEIFVLRLDRSVSSRYFFYYIQAPSFQDEACSTMCGVGGLKRISPIFMRICAVFLPPLSEQQAIADYLDEKCAKIDAAIDNIGKQIDASKRLKRALINEVITGQRAV